MRRLIIGAALIALILVGLAPNSAIAQRATTKVNYGPTCICQFGYGGNACVAAIACGIEGGRCSKPCAPPNDSQAVH
jgi:hypothetical protein